MSLVGVEVIDHHTRALASKCQGGGSADAATGAGDDGGPAREHNPLRGLLDSIVSNPGNTDTALTPAFFRCWWSGVFAKTPKRKTEKEEKRETEAVVEKEVE